MNQDCWAGLEPRAVEVSLVLDFIGTGVILGVGGKVWCSLSSSSTGIGEGAVMWVMQNCPSFPLQCIFLFLCYSQEALIFHLVFLALLKTFSHVDGCPNCFFYGGINVLMSYYTILLTWFQDFLFCAFLVFKKVLK
jgi:hypothetical protein